MYECDCQKGGTVLFDQNGNRLPQRSADEWRVEQYGPLPTVKADEASPITFKESTGTNGDPCYTAEWSARQSGRQLVAADGVTVLFTAPQPATININDSLQVNNFVSSGGLQVTKNGENSFTIELCFDPLNPPDWHVNASGCIAAGPQP